MKKRLFAMVLAVMMAVSMMATTAFAVEPEEESAGEKKLYSMTLDIDPLANGGSRSAYADTVTLSMPGYSNDWSLNKPNVDFTTLPSNAVVETVEIYPLGDTELSGPSKIRERLCLFTENTQRVCGLSKSTEQMLGQPMEQSNAPLPGL